MIQPNLRNKQSEYCIKRRLFSFTYLDEPKDLSDHVGYRARRKEGRGKGGEGILPSTWNR